MQAMSTLQKEVEAFYEEILKDNLRSKFALLNHKLTTLALPRIDDMRWLKGIPDLKDPNRNVAVWDKIPMPVIHYSRSHRSGDGSFLDGFNLTKWNWREHEVSEFLNLSDIGRASGPWQTEKIIPERVIEFVHRDKIFLAGLWTRQSIEGGRSAHSLTLGRKC